MSSNRTNLKDFSKQRGKNSSSGGPTIIHFTLYYTAMVTKTVGYWNKNYIVGQLKKVKDSEINVHIGRYLIFKKMIKRVVWEKVHIFNKGYW